MDCSQWPGLYVCAAAAVEYVYWVGVVARKVPIAAPIRTFVGDFLAKCLKTRLSCLHEFLMEWKKIKHALAAYHASCCWWVLYPRGLCGPVCPFGLAMGPPSLLLACSAISMNGLLFAFLYLCDNWPTSGMYWVMAWHCRVHSWQSACDSELVAFNLQHVFIPHGGLCLLLPG